MRDRKLGVHRSLEHKNRSAPGQKHGHRGNHRFPIRTFSEKNQISQKMIICFCPVVGFWGADFGEFPGEFWAIFGAPERNDNHPSERL